MHADTRNALRDPRLLGVREAWFERLEGLYAGETQDRAFVLHGIQLYTEDDGPDWEPWLDGSLDALAGEAGKSLDRAVYRPLCINYNPHGVHFVDHLFGARVYPLDGSWQAQPLDAPVGTLGRPDLDRLPAWRAMQDFCRAFLARDVPAVLFGLPTIASALNVAVNLYGQEILLAMLTGPGAAQRDLQTINDLLLDLHRWYLSTIPRRQHQCIIPGGRCQPPGYGQLCGCTTHLISADAYRSFVAPLDDALLSLYPHGGMIHLCGRHTQHIPVWNEMASLRALQLNDRAAVDLPIYFRQGKGDLVFYVNPCEDMPVERILAITGGQRVVIVADLPEPPSEGETSEVRSGISAMHHDVGRLSIAAIDRQQRAITESRATRFD